VDSNYVVFKQSCRAFLDLHRGRPGVDRGPIARFCHTGQGARAAVLGSGRRCQRDRRDVWCCVFGRRLYTRWSLPDGQIAFQIDAQPGLSVIVQGSSNLVNWLDLQTTDATGASFDFVDSTATNLVRRFYRLQAR